MDEEGLVFVDFGFFVRVGGGLVGGRGGGFDGVVFVLVFFICFYCCEFGM